MSAQGKPEGKVSLTGCEHAIGRACGDKWVSKGEERVDSADRRTACSELLVLCHEPPECCGIPRCAHRHCNWIESELGESSRAGYSNLLLLIVRHVDHGGSAFPDTDGGPVDPYRRESLIHLRFWHVQR
jgi:hypothetical protein